HTFLWRGGTKSVLPACVDKPLVPAHTPRNVQCWTHIRTTVNTTLNVRTASASLSLTYFGSSEEVYASSQAQAGVISDVCSDRLCDSGNCRHRPTSRVFERQCESVITSRTRIQTDQLQ